MTLNRKFQALQEGNLEHEDALSEHRYGWLEIHDPQMHFLVLTPLLSPF